MSTKLQVCDDNPLLLEAKLYSRAAKGAKIWWTNANGPWKQNWGLDSGGSVAIQLLNWEKSGGGPVPLPLHSKFHQPCYFNGAMHISCQWIRSYARKMPQMMYLFTLTSMHEFGVVMEFHSVSSKFTIMYLYLLKMVFDQVKNWVIHRVLHIFLPPRCLVLNGTIWIPTYFCSFITCSCLTWFLADTFALSASSPYNTYKTRNVEAKRYGGPCDKLIFKWFVLKLINDKRVNCSPS